MSSNIINGIEATKGMMRGIQEATALIRPTYGGAGTNVIVESHKNPGHIVVNDCDAIVQSIHLTDPAEKRGLAFIKELSARTDKMTGDNRKTTVILMEEILKAGYEADINKLELKKELDTLIPLIESEIDKHTKKITVNDVAAVATTASENEETGKLLQEIYQKIGKNGIIHVEGSGTYETSYKFIDGVRFDMTGFLSPFMVHDEQAIADKTKETKAIYEHPLILVTKKKITTDDDINPLLWELKNQDTKDLVIFTQDMDSGVAAMLINLHQKKEFNILIIKAPTLWRDSVFEDFAKCTGATVVEDASGINFKNLQVSHLGTCGKIIVDEDETIVMGTSDISDHIAALTSKQDDESKLRLSWLTNKTAILKIGSNSETDLSYKRLKTNDAVRSSQLALKYGIVAGGGSCALNVSKMMPDTISGNILKIALQAPIKQIMANTNYTYQLPISNLGLGENPTLGFNAKTLELVDMFDAGIIDSAQTLKSAIRNAIGIASTILTANGLVYIPEKTPQQIAYEIAMSKQYDF